MVRFEDEGILSGHRSKDEDIYQFTTVRCCDRDDNPLFTSAGRALLRMTPLQVPALLTHTTQHRITKPPTTKR